MNFTREDFIGNLYETSKSKKDGHALLNKSEQNIQVYNFDKVKLWFCNEYRNGEKLRSCDAYYSDIYRNRLVMEFKNTNHLKMKEYMGEIEEKIIDTHMILAETFFRGEKISKISKELKLLVVYNDQLSLGDGVRNIGTALNTMKPKQGDTTRESKSPKCYIGEEEYQNAMNEIKKKFCPDYFVEIDFINKEVFYSSHITPGNYFLNLL